MRKLFLLFLASFQIAALAQSGDMEIVHQFGKNLQMWCSTTDISYRPKIQDKCLSDCRVKDEIMVDFARNGGLSIKDYVVPNYLNGFQEAMDKGAITVAMSNVRIISSDQQSYSYKNAKEEKERAKKFTTVACDIKVRGVLDYDIKDLFYLQKGKILKITPYEEVVDKKTGKKRIKVDFSDLGDDATVGFTYNYGKHFPIGGSFNYSPESSLFMVSIDLGVTLDNDKYIIDKVEMNDIMNYDRKKKILNPRFFLTVTPQFYMKYFAIGCGVGFLCMDGTEYIASYSYTSSSPSGSNVSASGQSSENGGILMVKPMIRPVAKGFIPLRSNELYLSVSIGYDLIFGYKEKNGLNFGIGFQWEL